MVKHKGLCPSLKRSVEFDVNEIIELKTKRGTKYQVKGDYEGRTCSTFCSKEKAMELKSALGQTTMSAESEDMLGQAHQDESVAPIDNNVQPLAQGQEPMEDMPVQETVATPITDTSVGVEAIDNLQLNDADALANMATQFDDAPDMVADFEIAPQEPEGDGRSIGNIRPMNEDVPLHAESEDGTGQAHQEEGVAPIETDVQPLAEGQEPMENMPIQETVATPITNSSVGVEAIDNLQHNDADALANMATQFDDAPEMLADFEISFMQPFGDGQSIGNNTPMNPDVPLHAETFESPIQTVNPMDETTLTTPPPVCFVEKIPPVVWENMSVLEQIEYAETGNESLLSCPQCGITKAELRDAGGYCAVSDPEGSEYNSSVDCPYQKHFAPSHWLDEEYVVGHVEGDMVEVSERLPAEVDMPKMKNPQKELETMVIPYFVWNKIYSQFNGGITAEPDLSGLNYTLQFHGMMKPQIKNLIEVAEGDHDIMFGSETYTATVLKAEGDRGYFIDSATVRPYGAETFESPATKEVLTLDEAFPSEWFEVPVIAPESGDERYKNCLDCGNPYLVENIRGYGWEASYSNHRPETNGMCDSSLDFDDYDAQSIKTGEICGYKGCKGNLLETEYGGSLSKLHCDKCNYSEFMEWDAETFEANPFAGRWKDGSLRLLEEEEADDDTVIQFFIRKNNAFSYDVLLKDAQIKDERLKPMKDSMGDSYWIIGKIRRLGVIDGEMGWEMIVPVLSENKISWEKKPHHKGQLMIERYSETLYGAVDSIMWWFREQDGGLDFYNWVNGSFGAETFEADGDDTYFLFYYKDSPEHNRRNQVDEEYWDDWNMLEDYIDDGASKEEALEQFQGLVNLWGKSYPHSIIEAQLVEIDGNTGEEKTITSWKANAKEFNVEFDDWADQEMLTHGKDVSFKEWAKEEGKKHGDMDLTDWAEEEEESHDERYEAEGVHHDGGRSDGGKFLSNCCDADITTMDGKKWKCMKCNSPVEVNVEELEEWYGAEDEPLRVWAKDMEKDHLGYLVSKNKDGWETWRGLCGITSDKGISRGFDVSNYDGSYGRRCRKCLTAYKKMGEELNSSYGAEEYEITISDNNMDFGDSHKTFNDEKEALEEAWELSQKETDMFVYVRGNDGKVIRVFRPNLGHGAETFEAEGYKCRWNGKLYKRIGRKPYHTRTLTGEPITYNHRVCMGCGEGCWSDVYDAETFESPATQDKPSLKSVGLLLGVGALATYFAPKSMRDFLNRLK